MLEFDDHYIDLAEEYACQNKMQLERREGEIMRATENTVNRYIAGRTKAEYRRDNVVKIKEYTQRPEVKLHLEERHECLCGGRFTTDNKAQHHKSKKHKEYVEFMALTEEQVKAMLYI
jgi:hypothetical protein